MLTVVTWKPKRLHVKTRFVLLKRKLRHFLAGVQREEHQRGGTGIHDTALIGRVEPSSFVAAVGRLFVHLGSSKNTACPGDSWTAPERQLPRKRSGEQLEFEAWPDFRNIRNWRLNFRSEVFSLFSGAQRPIEATVWINEIESAKSVVDLKTSYSNTGDRLQTNFATGEWFQDDHQRRLQKKSRHSRKSCTSRKTLSHGRASRMDDL